MIKLQDIIMVLIDKRILAGGIALLVVGFALTISISSTMPIGQAGMTEEEAMDLLIAQQENEDYTTLSGMLIGVGFLLILISFGARRRKGSAKREEKKQLQRNKQQTPTTLHAQFDKLKTKLKIAYKYA